MTYRRIALGTAAAIGVLLPLATQAAEMPLNGPAYREPVYKAPMYQQPPASWAGWYAGIYAGYGFGSSSSSVDFSGPLAAAFPGAGLPTSLSTSLDGFLAGAQLGYNWQWGNWIFGPELDFGYSGIKGSASATAGPNTPTAEQRIDWFGTVRARIGYALWNDLLLYGTGGLAYGTVGLETAINGISTAASKRAFGYTFGGGLEYALLQRWTVKAEYLYYDLGSLSETNNLIALTSAASFKGHIARGGVNYRF